MFQKSIFLLLTLFISFAGHAQDESLGRIECTAPDVTDMNRFSLKANVTMLSPALFQSYFEPSVTLAGPDQKEENTDGHLISGKITSYPAGTLYVQDVWHLQGTYEDGDNKINYSILVDAKNYTSSTITVNEVMYYAQCLRAL